MRIPGDADQRSEYVPLGSKRLQLVQCGCATPNILKDFEVVDAISIPTPFLLFNSLPKVAQLRVGIQGVPGRKRHRIRHLEFCRPRLLTEMFKVRILPGEPTPFSSRELRTFSGNSALWR